MTTGPKQGTGTVIVTFAGDVVATCGGLTREEIERFLASVGEAARRADARDADGAGHLRVVHPIAA